MKLSSLRYLVAFADEGSISKAAERCGVSQPTLSVALQNLETDLGATLLERGKGQVALSILGHEVVQQARRTLEEAQRVELIAQNGKDPFNGVFRLGVIHTIAPYLLPGLISCMHSRTPDMKLYIEESMTSLLTEYLKQGSIDVAIIAMPFDVFAFGFIEITANNKTLSSEGIYYFMTYVFTMNFNSVLTTKNWY